MISKHVLSLLNDGIIESGVWEVCELQINLIIYALNTALQKTRLLLFTEFISRSQVSTYATK